MFKIEKGIPVPEGRKGTIYSTMKAMEVGDSVLLPMAFYAAGHANAKRLNIKIRQQKQDSESFRLWRIE